MLLGKSMGMDKVIAIRLECDRHFFNFENTTVVTNHDQTITNLGYFVAKSSKSFFHRLLLIMSFFAKRLIYLKHNCPNHLSHNIWNVYKHQLGSFDNKNVRSYAINVSLSARNPIAVSYSFDGSCNLMIFIILGQYMQDKHIYLYAPGASLTCYLDLVDISGACTCTNLAVTKMRSCSVTIVFLFQGANKPKWVSVSCVIVRMIFILLQ